MTASKAESANEWVKMAEIHRSGTTNKENIEETKNQQKA